MFPWNLVINGETIRLNDEDFFIRIRDLACLDMDNNRLDRLREFYISLEMMDEQHGRFYIRNHQHIDGLKNRIDNFIKENKSQCHAFCFCKKQ